MFSSMLSTLQAQNKNKNGRKIFFTVELII